MSHSTQKAPAGSGDSSDYPWCSAGAGIPSLPQYDPQVRVSLLNGCYFSILRSNVNVLSIADRRYFLLHFLSF